MIKGLGCDVVYISRIEKAIKRENFLMRVFTDMEREVIAKKGMQTAAGMWAAKEAVSKALGTGFRGFSLRDVEVQHDALGAPQIKLYNGALGRFNEMGATSIFISLSHEGDIAMAVATVE